MVFYLHQYYYISLANQLELRPWIFSFYYNFVYQVKCCLALHICLLFSWSFSIKSKRNYELVGNFDLNFGIVYFLHIKLHVLIIMTSSLSFDWIWCLCSDFSCPCTFVPVFCSGFNFPLMFRRDLLIIFSSSLSLSSWVRKHISIKQK